ncbi:gamma-glutamylcyclotransferase [uncultured Stenotrophomonas sp.]|uniref:gamma-glutamylcyclotransferase n=1 Tax=uncultured Stenotrophomonas sp. TaxID=165438 RepID=UPI0025F2736B|nr:gamma-glutamylcyclotransferase [uncultured Stenotrophomonas sp.]
MDVQLLSPTSMLSGEYRRIFDELPEGDVLSPAQIQCSMEQALKIGPSLDEGLWIFAYGSLIWNPTVKHDRRERASLPNWRRSFCMHLVAGRATLAEPGRMLSLESGGRTDGIAYRIPTADVANELPTIWLREMVTGAYVPRWLDLELEGGQVCRALVFTASLSANHWCADSSPEAAAPVMSKATGPLGSNADYALLLRRALARENIQDAYVKEVAELIEMTNV